MLPLEGFDKKACHCLISAVLTHLFCVGQVVHLAANNLRETWEDVQKIANALGLERQGIELIQHLQQRMAGAVACASGRPAPRVACIQWPDPWYSASLPLRHLVHLTQHHVAEREVIPSA